jgi:cytochrome P450
MNAVRPVAEQMIDRLLDRAVEAGTIDVVNELARPLSLGVIASLLGVPQTDYDRFTVWSDLLTGFIGGALNVPDRRQRALGALRELTAYFDNLIAERRIHPTSDMIGSLAGVQDGKHGALSDEEIAATGAMLLFAGHGTTTNSVGNMLLAFLRWPEQLKLLGQDPKLVPQAMDELLRYDSPVHITVRIARRDGVCGISDATKGDRVFLFIGAANRDPLKFECPDQFDILRPDRQHVSFGYGLHYCLGAPLAKIEITALLGRLLERLTHLELAVNPDELKWESTVGFRGLKSLPIAVR